MKFVLCALVLFIFVGGACVVPAHAQTVSIANLQYPTKPILINKEFIVNYTVNYAGASSGDLLATGVFVAGTTKLTAGSTISSSPDTCQQATGSYSWAAACTYNLSGLQGSESVSFALQENTVGTFQFSAVAGIGNSTGSMVAETTSSDNEFSVSIIDKFTLTISVPSHVSVTLDGVQQAAGSTNIQLNPGPHVISTPPIVQLDSTSRLRFNGWSDGSNETTRTFDLESDTQISANYVTQYYVSASSDSTLISGWYDSGATIQLSVDQSQALNSYRVLLSGFNGWYNGDQLVSSSPSTTITVTGSLNLSAKWNILPYVPPIVAVAAIVGLVLFLRRRKGGVSSPGYRPAYQPYAGRPSPAFASCTSCGSQIPFEARFCRKCGARQGR